MRKFTPEQIAYYIDKSEKTRKEFHYLKYILIDRKVKIMVEIGLWKATLSDFVLQNCPDIQEYWGIDPWKYYPSSDDQMDPYYKGISTIQWDTVASQAYSVAIKFKQFHIIRLPSKDAVRLFDDSFFDCVFIDADHSYRSVFQDISNWAPKLKSTGILCGDDFHRKSVRKAINLSFIKNIESYKKYWVSI